MATVLAQANDNYRVSFANKTIQEFWIIVGIFISPSLLASNSNCIGKL